MAKVKKAAKAVDLVVYNGTQFKVTDLPEGVNREDCETLADYCKPAKAAAKK